jgi:outer membrane receptor protein involved in Fe transport
MRQNSVTPFLFALEAIALCAQAYAERQLEELLVTAEKRGTTVQDTPIAVSAFSQEDLERGLINNMSADSRVRHRTPGQLHSVNTN